MPPATVCAPEVGSSAFDCAPARSRRGSRGARSNSSRFGLERRTDAGLVALAQTGAESAYEEIMRRYRRQLHAYCAQMLGPSRAEDAVQQTFLQAFVALRRGSDREINLRPWLYRISHNCSIDMLRKNGWDYDELDPEYDGVAQPPQLLEQKQELEKMVGAMRALPERQRRALALRELEGRSYREIGAELGHTDAGVRQLIFRARSALRSGAAAIGLPFALLRTRLLTQVAPASDTQQAAVAASLGGDSAGVGLAKVSAVLVAGISLLTAAPPAEHSQRHGSHAGAHGNVPATTAGDGDHVTLSGSGGQAAHVGGGSPSGGGRHSVSLPGAKNVALTPAAGAPATTVESPAAQQQPAASGPDHASPTGSPGSSGSSKGSGPAGKNENENPDVGTGGNKPTGNSNSGKGENENPNVGSGSSGSKRGAKKVTPEGTSQRQTNRHQPELTKPNTNKLSSTNTNKVSVPKQSAPKTVGSSNSGAQQGSPGPAARGQSPTRPTGHTRGPASGKGSPASSR